MGYVTLTTRAHFDAAHMHPDPATGKCHRLHGHTYQVVMELVADTESEGQPEGMAFDLTELREWWRTQMDERLDHHYLNEVLPDSYQPPTIEHVAAYILDSAHNMGFPLTAVVVQEGLHHSARVGGGIPFKRTKQSQRKAVA